MATFICSVSNSFSTVLRLRWTLGEEGGRGTRHTCHVQGSEYPDAHLRRRLGSGRERFLTAPSGCEFCWGRRPTWWTGWREGRGRRGERETEREEVSGSAVASGRDVAFGSTARASTWPPSAHQV